MERLRGAEIASSEAAFIGVNVVVADREYESCRFAGLTITSYDSARMGERVDPLTRPRVENVALRSCSVHPAVAIVQGAILDDVTIQDLDGELWLLHCAFRHVRLEGLFTNLKIESTAFRTETQWRAIDDDNARRHTSVDWALDLRQARFRNPNIVDVPSEKLVIDDTRQALVDSVALRQASGVFEDFELVGLVGQRIRRALASGEEALGSGPQADAFFWVEDGSATSDQELELITRLHLHGIARGPWTPGP